MLLLPLTSWLLVKPVRLNLLSQCKDRFLLSCRRPRTQRLGVRMPEKARIGSGSSWGIGGSAGEGDAILGGDKLPGPRREPETWRASVDAALNRMSKWLVSGSFVLAAIWRHDAEVMWAFVGAVLNMLLSSILKLMFNHERPAPALRSDPGMPSSHAQSIFYAATFLVLSLFYWIGAKYLAVIVGAATIASASYLSWLRVSQRLHTLNQVLVGVTVGSTFGALWFMLWRLLVEEAFASSLWVRVTIILGSVAFCVGFVIHAVQHWFKDE